MLQVPIEVTKALRSFLFSLGGKDFCVLCTSTWLLLAKVYLVNVKCHASFKWLECWETALKAVKPAKVWLLRHDLSLKNPFSQKFPQIANSLLGLSDQFLFIEWEKKERTTLGKLLAGNFLLLPCSFSRLLSFFLACLGCCLTDVSSYLTLSLLLCQ